jgi:hypothetical protein
MVKNSVASMSLDKSEDPHWITVLNDTIKTVAVILVLGFLIAFLENPNLLSIQVIFFTAFSATVSIIALKLVGLTIRKELSLKYGLTLGGISIGISILMYLLGLYYEWNWYPDIEFNMIFASIQIGIVAGEILTNIIFIIPFGAKSKEAAQKGMDQYGSRLSASLSQSRFSLTFLLAMVGILLLISGFFIDLAWYYQYLISIVLLTPFVYFVIQDLQTKGQLKGIVEPWLKRTHMLNGFIEGGIMLALFLILITVVWNLLGDYQGIGLNNWIIISFVISIGVTMLIHVLLSRDTTSAFREKLSIGSKTDGINELDFKERLLLLELVLISFLSFIGFWFGYTFQQILAEETNAYIGILIILLNLGLFVVILSLAQYYYADYYFKTHTLENIYQAPRTIYLLGGMYFGIIILGVLLYRLTPSFDLFLILDIVAILVILFGFLLIIFLPKNITETGAERVKSQWKRKQKEVKEDSDAEVKLPVKAIPWIMLALGIVGLGLSLYFLIWANEGLSLTWLIILTIILLLSGFELVYLIMRWILISRKEKESAKSSKADGTLMETLGNPILLIILGAITIIIGILLVVLFSINPISLWVGIILIGIGATLVILFIIPKFRKGEKTSTQIQYRDSSVNIIIEPKYRSNRYNFK